MLPLPIVIGFPGLPAGRCGMAEACGLPDEILFENQVLRSAGGVVWSIITMVRHIILMMVQRLSFRSRLRINRWRLLGWMPRILAVCA
jgi:hypothetical protein